MNGGLSRCRSRNRFLATVLWALPCAALLAPQAMAQNPRGARCWLNAPSGAEVYATDALAADITVADNHEAARVLAEKIAGSLVDQVSQKYGVKGDPRAVGCEVLASVTAAKLAIERLPTTYPRPYAQPGRIIRTGIVIRTSALTPAPKVAPAPKPAPKPRPAPSAALTVKTDTSLQDAGAKWDEQVREQMRREAAARARTIAETARATANTQARQEKFFEEMRKRGRAQ